MFFTQKREAKYQMTSYSLRYAAYNTITLKSSHGALHVVHSICGKQKNCIGTQVKSDPQ